MVREGQQSNPDRERVMPGLGEQVACCLGTDAFLAHMRSTDANDKPALSTVPAGAAAGNVHVDRSIQRCLGVTRISARGGRVDTKRAGGAFEGCGLLGRLAGGRQHGEHLQATQLGCPGQQVRDQQDAQPGDVRSAAAAPHMRTHP